MFFEMKLYLAICWHSHFCNAFCQLSLKQDGWWLFRWVRKGLLDEESLFSLLALDRNLKGLTPFTMSIRIPSAGVRTLGRYQNHFNCLFSQK